MRENHPNCWQKWILWKSEFITCTCFSYKILKLSSQHFLFWLNAYKKNYHKFQLGLEINYVVKGTDVDKMNVLIICSDSMDEGVFIICVFIWNVWCLVGVDSCTVGSTLTGFHLTTTLTKLDRKWLMITHKYHARVTII